MALGTDICSFINVLYLLKCRLLLGKLLVFQFLRCTRAHREGEQGEGSGRMETNGGLFGNITAHILKRGISHCTHFCIYSRMTPTFCEGEYLLLTYILASPHIHKHNYTYKL